MNPKRKQELPLKYNGDKPPGGGGVTQYVKVYA